MSDKKRIFAVYKDNIFQRHESGENRLAAWVEVYKRAIMDVGKVGAPENYLMHEAIRKAAANYRVVELEEK